MLQVPFSRDHLERSIPQVFADQVRAGLDKTAVRSLTGELTYGDLDQASNRLCKVILFDGDPPPRPVAFMVSPGISPVISILGILKSGNIYLPLDAMLPNNRLRRILEDSGARLVVTDSLHRARIQSLMDGERRIIDLDRIELVRGLEEPVAFPHPEQPCSLLYTSSTSAPKGVLQTHRNLLHCVLRYTNGCLLSRDDRFLLLASPAFAASVPDIFGSLLNGATLLCYTIQEGSFNELGRWMEREKATIYHSVPSLFRRFANGLSGEGLFPSLRMIILGGEAVLKSDVDLFRKHFSRGCLLHVGLGSTETNVVRRLFVDHDSVIESACVPVGYSVDDMEIEVQDERGDPLPPDQPGEIVVRSRYLAAGYWNQPELTQATFGSDAKDPSRRFFRTGDLGILRPDGCLLHLGRRDLQVKIRGIRIQVDEIEAALLGLNQFTEAAVVPIPDVHGELRLVAYLIPRELAEPPLQAAQLREQLASVFPETMVPSAFVPCVELPRTPTGKIDRRALMDLPVEWIERRSDRSADPPRTATESILVDLVGQVLGMEQAHLDDSLRLLGATSLQAMELARAVEIVFAKVIPWSMLAGTTTIRDLSVAIDSIDSGPRLAPLATNVAGSGRMPLFCVPGLLYGVELLRPLAQALAPRWDCYGLEYGIKPRLEPLGRTLVSEIRLIQPHGPYHLGGHSFGGWIAYEAARLLREAGEQVGLLLFFDTYGPGFPRPVNWWIGRQIRRWQILKTMPPRDRIAWIRERIENRLPWFTPRPQPEIPTARFAEAWAFISRDIRAERQAYLSRLEPYPDPVVLLRATTQQESRHLSWSDRYNGLAPYAPGGIRVIDLPGNHGSMVSTPEFVSVIDGLMKGSSLNLGGMDCAGCARRLIG